MKQLERKKLTTYRWWRASGVEIDTGDCDVHVTLLDEHAEQRIAEMTMEGFTSGGLCLTLIDLAGEEIEYMGWWGVSTPEDLPMRDIPCHTRASIFAAGWEYGAAYLLSAKHQPGDYQKNIEREMDRVGVPKELPATS